MTKRHNFSLFLSFQSLKQTEIYTFRLESLMSAFSGKPDQKPQLAELIPLYCMARLIEHCKSESIIFLWSPLQPKNRKRKGGRSLLSLFLCLLCSYELYPLLYVLRWHLFKVILLSRSFHLQQHVAFWCLF